MDQLDDDIFSPLRLDSSTVDFDINSIGSLTDLSICDTRFSFSNTASKNTLEEICLLSEEQKQDIKTSSVDSFLEIEDSVFTCIPVSKKNSSSSSNRNTNLSNIKEVKLDEILNFKEKNIERDTRCEYSGYLQKQNSESREILKNDLVLFPKQTSSEKKLLQSSISSNSVKVGKEKNNKTSKITSREDIKKSGSKCVLNEKMVDPSDKKKHMYLPLKDTLNKYNSNAGLESVMEESGSSNQDTVNLETAACLPLSQYEAKIEKIVHDCMSEEFSKLRQNLYLQQMSFYRQINKIRQEMEQEHKKTNNHLIKVIKELMQRNADLKSYKNDVPK